MTLAISALDAAGAVPAGDIEGLEPTLFESGSGELEVAYLDASNGLPGQVNHY